MKRPKAAFAPCMGSTVVGARGQVVVPKDIRDKMGLKEGTTLVAFYHENGPLVMLPADQMHEQIAKLTKGLKKLSR
ncbi:MAG TPA: AbrB/MazE/SpoVT family DNA-binding domain-containing protein [Candidatus Methylomirabilis sp.]|nr:AbrB/MazE/SpoVT family DNA-binding domain-containing protein [Candidatus Methylomirabilis sp.]